MERPAAPQRLTERLADRLAARLTDRLVGAIYALVRALAPVVDTIASSPARPWHRRESLASRFSAIIQDLLALTARIHPGALRPAALRPAALRNAPVSAPSRPAEAAPRPAHRSHGIGGRQPGPPPLTARRLARCLAILLQRLQRLAAEAAATLPAPVRRHAARLHALTGCGAVPSRNAQPAWKGAG